MVDAEEHAKSVGKRTAHVLEAHAHATCTCHMPHAHATRTPHSRGRSPRSSHGGWNHPTIAPVNAQGEGMNVAGEGMRTWTPMGAGVNVLSWQV